MANTKITLPKEEFDNILKEMKNLYQLYLNASSKIIFIRSELKRVSNCNNYPEIITDFFKEEQ